MIAKERAREEEENPERFDDGVTALEHTKMLAVVRSRRDKPDP